MLKAYDYSENRKQNIIYKNEKLFEKEKQIAKEFLDKNPILSDEKKCPVCNGNYVEKVFERWNTDYMICGKCHSIFVPCEEQSIEKYLRDKGMMELRLSEEYQLSEEKKRINSWNEQLMWIRYRIFRYLGKKENVNIIDFGNRYKAYVDLISSASFIGNYELRQSILGINTKSVENADVVLYLNQLQHETNPIKTLRELGKNLLPDGLIIINTRLGSGFDILTLKGHAEDIYPYEHIMLPSKEGLEIILEKAGYELLEITTPGSRDLETVKLNQDKLGKNNLFISYMLDVADDSMFRDFQQFLQKSGLSSFAQVIARKVER